MSNVPRGWTTDEGQRLADASRWPVLARLPDAPADPLVGRFAKSVAPTGHEYRFDPPQSGEVNSQLTGNAHQSVSQQPHMFERRRPLGQRAIPRRESSVLPRTNPFSNPRPRLVDSIAPAVRFLTMVALFTAAGVWIQMLGRHSSAPTHSLEQPRTVAQPVVAPTKNANDHTIPAPTATGPIETEKDSGARVGRAEGDDFAVQKNSAAGPVATSSPTVTPPHFLISSGNSVPRVRVSDAASGVSADSTGSATSSANGGTSSSAESDGSPSVARYPGFFMDIPTR